MTNNNTEDKKYKLNEVLYGAADASGNNNAGAVSTSASGTYGSSATQLGGTALSLG